jgi:hypothetical protein
MGLTVKEPTGLCRKPSKQEDRSAAWRQSRRYHLVFQDRRQECTRLNQAQGYWHYKIQADAHGYCQGRP